jgi:hypothetical protein
VRQVAQLAEAGQHAPESKGGDDRDRDDQA